MKARTYGKKTRTLPAAPTAFLEASPSDPSSTTKAPRPLTERSNNARTGLRLWNHARKAISSGLYDNPQERLDTKQSRDNNAIRINVSLEQRGSCPQVALRTPRRSPRKTQAPGLTPTQKTIEDEVSTAFAELSLASIHDPHHQRSARSPIERRMLQERPANVTEVTQKYISPLLDCKNVSKCIEDFHSWMEEREDLLSISKIGEGSFGEVYRARGGADAVILKLMPLNAQRGKGSRSFTSVSAAKNEVRLLSRMSKVPGFVEFRGACVLQGTMPHQLVHEWNQYLLSGRTVESKDPRKKDSYSATQLWLLIEMSDAGESLERGRYTPPGLDVENTSKSKEPYLPPRYVWDIFWQIVKALAKGEVFAMYEHRDLHLGNICIKDRACTLVSASPCPRRGGQFTPSSALEESCIVFGFDTAGIEVTLIDYSLSRASIGPAETLAYDFKNDKALLRGKGDLQYDMYRHMASLLGSRDSSNFEPQTNVMWLHYVLSLLIEAVLKSSDLVEGEMMEILSALRDQLHPSKQKDWEWHSAGDLLQTGVEEGWFLPTHVIDL